MLFCNAKCISMGPYPVQGALPSNSYFQKLILDLIRPQDLIRKAEKGCFLQIPINLMENTCALLNREVSHSVAK
jgi:hypothetical protein